MSTKLTFQLDPCGAVLLLEHFPMGVGDSWEDTAVSSSMLFASGNVDSSDPTKLVCFVAGGQRVVTLLGTNWNAKPGDSGTATCDTCRNTTTEQTWTVT